MRISLNTNVLSFGKAIPASKKQDYTDTVKAAKSLLEIDGGLSVLKIQGASMPKQEGFDTGVGKINSDSALDFIDKMTFYTDTNTVKEFPAGQTTKHSKGFFCPYLKTALTFGEEKINLLNLVNDKKTYGSILSKKDIEAFNLNSKRKRVEYENELGQDENYPILKPLKTAYDNFKKGLAPKELEEEFEAFKETPRVKETYARLALYPYLKDKEPDLFKDFDRSPEKQLKFEEYKEKYKDEIEFFNFRQFLAKKEHLNAKEKINALGKDFFGDCLIGFSKQEVWAHPDAFEKDACVGLASWGLPALNFDEILTEGSESNKVFKDKISFFLENYDGIRFDVGWCYAIGQSQVRGKEQRTFDFGHKLYDLIEQTAHDIKGKDYDTGKLVYEMDGFSKMFNWENDPKPIENVRGIKSVLTTEWEHRNKKGWGSVDFYKRTGLTEDELLIGTNNHDGSNLRRLAEDGNKENLKKVKDNANVLSKIFNVSKEILIENPKKFIETKFAELYTTKNQFLFFTDVMGSRYDMDDQTVGVENYRFRLNKDFERQYHTALQKGQGFNLMQSLKTAMEVKGLDKQNPEIYDKTCYWADYLRQKGAKTEREADLEETLNSQTQSRPNG